MTWTPHTSWGGLVITTGARISELGKKALQKAGLSHLSHGRIGVMSLLLDKPATQAQLCAALKQKPPSMMELLQRLEKEGLVNSTPDKLDGRKTNWSLTAKGRKDITKAREVFRKTGRMIDHAFDTLGITPEELQKFKDLLVAFNTELSRHTLEES